MFIKVSGKHLDVGDALRTHVEERLTDGVQKYFDRPVETQVVFTKDAHLFRCDASVHLPTGLTAKAQGKEPEIYAAFEQAAARIEKQLRRHKRRLKDHHQSRSAPLDAFQAQAYVIRQQGEEAEEAAPTEGEGGMEPLIIAEMKHDFLALSVGEAVMQMELASAPFLIFKNDANGRLNIVFQRDDGNVGWIDPANLEDA